MTRSPKEIDAFCRSLAGYWKCVPMLRFGQLVDNAASHPDNAPLFYIEDTQMIRSLERFIGHDNSTNTKDATK